MSSTLKRIVNVRPTSLVGCLALVVSLFSQEASSQLVNARFVSSVYSFEKFDTVSASNSYLRGAQSLLLGYTHESVSIYTHLQLAGTFKTKFERNPDFRAFYLYGKIRDIGGMVDLSLGRVPYYAGVGNGTVDGGLATFRFSQNRVRFTVYGGARVPYELTLNGWEPIKRNFIIGGQLLVTSVENLRLGFSYVNRQRERQAYWSLRADSLFNLVDLYITPPALKDQLIGADAQYLWANLRINGRYDYNLNTSETQRAQIGLRFDINNSLTFAGDVIHRAPRIWYNSFFSVFPVSSVNEYEAGLDYRFGRALRAFGRIAFVDYTDDESLRYTLGLAHSYGSVSYRGNSGFAGELSNFSLQGSYPFLERMLVPTLGFTYGSYKLNSVAEREDLFSLIAGTTIRPGKTISFNFQVQALNNKILKNDIRFFGTFTFWLAEQL